VAIGLGATDRILTSKSGDLFVWQSGDISSKTTGIATVSGLANTEVFGGSVAIGDGRIVVGSPWYDEPFPGDNQSGKVYIYDLNGNPVGVQTLYNPRSVDDSYYGASVAVGNGRIVVGSPGDDSEANQSGAVFIYDLNGNPVGVKTITDPNGKVTEWLGTSVAVGNGRIVVGAPGWDESSFDTEVGKVFIYDLDGNPVGVHTLTNLSYINGGGDIDFFGRSVAVGNGKIVVGSPNFGSSGNITSISNLLTQVTSFGIGNIEIFDLNGNRTGIITSPAYGTGVYDYFGNSVAVGSERIVVGCPGWNSQRGRVIVYDLDGNTVGIITHPNTAAADFFGYSVAVGNGRIVVGAAYDDDNNTNAGSIHIYNIDGNYIESFYGSAFNENFGFSVDVGNGRIVMSSSYVGFNGTGKIHIKSTPQVYTLHDAIDLHIR